VTVDRRDRRLFEVLQHRVGTLEEPAELTLARAHRGAALFRGHAALEPGVGPGREHRRRAGDDDDPGGRVVAQLGEGGAELGQHRVAQRVAPVGAVHGDGGDEAVAREEDVFTHGGSIIIGLDP
jgi:hypothetical protein